MNFLIFNIYNMKNTIFYLILLLMLIIGLAGGYLLGISSSDTKTVFVERCLENDSSNKNENSTDINNGEIDLTAKEAIEIAIIEARSWSADAYLSEIVLSSKNFNINGLSNGWKTVFYSEEKNKVYEILIKDGESRGGKEREVEDSLQTLKGELVDSSILAKSFFSLYAENTEIISLKMYYDSNAQKFLWTIFYPKGSHTIDAEL